MYQKLAGALGINFVPIGTVEQFDRIAGNADLWRASRALWVVARGVGEFLEPFYRAIVANHQPGRTVLVMASLVLGGRAAQEELKIPAVTVHLSPAVLRSVLDPASTPPLPVAPWQPAWLNRMVFAFVDRAIIDPAFGGPLNAFRASRGMPPVNGIFRTWIHSPDRVIGLFPAWFAPPAPDWPPNTLLTGFPLYDEADVTPIDAELLRFLDDGPPPIAFTPGSSMRHGAKFFAAAVDVCQALKMRGLLFSRHDANVPRDLPAQIRHVKFAPFSRILPRCAAVVHHGGIGTSAQALAAGIPQLVMPMAHDQHDNARRLARLGVAQVIPAWRFTAPRARRGLARLLRSRAVADYCAAARQKIERDNPFERTALVIEETAKPRIFDFSTP
jgi:UDP:flavonoid glycosyltransferase YjiC (YdhE family)